jgi:predicted RNA-binding Zn ribbon-like protein
VNCYIGVMADADTPPPGAEVLVEFLNTLDQRTFARHGRRHEPRDELGSPAALARWLADHGLLGNSAARTRATATDLTDALAVRTALRDNLVSALDGDNDDSRDGDGHPAAPAALDAFRLYLVADRSGGLALACAPPRPTPVGHALATLIAAAATAGVRGTWDRVRVCAAPDCHWAFIDTSRRGDKRWCSTAVCGNRSKTADYRVRRREPQARHQP